MKSISIFLFGFIIGILFLLASITLADKYQTWKKARLEPVLVDISGCGDQGSRQGWEGR
jgi:hypothetical protein